MRTTVGFSALDFDHYHQHELPAQLASGRAALAAHATHGRGSIALKVREVGSYTYRLAGDGIEVVAGDAGADSVFELDQASWEGLVHEIEAPAGLLYARRIQCLRGDPMRIMLWEPGLRALYNGRPAYDRERLDLRDRTGRPLDVEQTFTLESERDDMAHFLGAAGYLFVRDVFQPGEIDVFLREAAALRGEARKGDKLSWWGKNRRGAEVLCRVTRANTQPGFATLPTDPRILALASLADEPLVHTKGEGEGVTVIFKHPEMGEGLGDLPWHRDCGMGGHAIMCPTLIASIYLTDATPETGELAMLPGSRHTSFYSIDTTGRHAPAGAHFRARPGGVSLHYGDTVHVAPPPTAPDLGAYRISAILSFARPGVAHHRGESSYNAVLHQRDDGQVRHLRDVARGK
jgi:hypothetical protein